VVYKGTANNTHEVEDVMMAANADKRCIGVITWMPIVVLKLK
jgi:L-arabinose isomerase